MAAIVRSVFTNGTIDWMTSINQNPNHKSIAVDPAEQNVYFTIYNNPIYVIKLAATNGNLVDSQSL